MAPLTEDSSRVNRHIILPAHGSSGLASVISIFCIGLVSGAAGGLLLGATAVVALQSLELLADNKQLMDQFNYTENGHHSENNLKDILQWESVNEVSGIRISIFAVIYGVFSSTFSLTVGLYFGLATHSLVIKNYSKAAMLTALDVAGPVCLIGVTVTGCILGLTLERFLSLTFKADVALWMLFSIVVSGWMLPTMILFSNSYMFVLLCGIAYTPIVASMTYLLSFWLEMRSILGGVLIPVILALKVLENSYSHKMTAAPVVLMLIISDVCKTAGHQIVSLQSPTSTNTRTVVVEAIFVGVVPALLWAVAVGMSLFVSCQRSGARRICASAASYGIVVLGIIELVLPVLGPGPSIGALMGVAGAVGVSLSAAGAATDQDGQEVDCYGLVGRLGVTVGAASGAFLSSRAHSGLSGMFMALCAAAIHAGYFLKLFLLPIRWRCCSSIYLVPAVVIVYIYAIAVFVSYVTWDSHQHT